jgi:hypothetical protein
MLLVTLPLFQLSHLEALGRKFWQKLPHLQYLKKNNDLKRCLQRRKWDVAFINTRKLFYGIYQRVLKQVL